MRRLLVLLGLFVATMFNSSTAKAVDITSIDPAQLATMNRTDPAFADLRSAWANLLDDEARDQRLSRMQIQLKLLQQRAVDIDAVHGKTDENPADVSVTFTPEEIAGRLANAAREIASMQKEIARLGKLKEYYRTGDSTAAGLGVDELEGTPPPDQVNQMVADLTLKINDQQKRLTNPAEPSAQERIELIQTRKQERLRLEQTRRPIAEGIAMLQKQIKLTSAQPVRSSKSDSEWLAAHRPAVEALMR